MNTISRLAAITCLIAAPAMAITPINGGGISGATSMTINVSNGDQTDPHVSGDITAYTDIQGATIRYFNFATGADAAIPAGPRVIDILSNVSGNLIAFSRIEADRNAIMFFNISTGTLTDVDTNNPCPIFQQSMSHGRQSTRLPKLADIVTSSVTSVVIVKKAFETQAKGVLTKRARETETRGE